MKRVTMHTKKAARMSKGLSHLFLLALLCSMVVFYSCEEDYGSYSGGDYIQFGPNPDDIYESSKVMDDTVKTYSFVYEGLSVTRDTVFFDLYVQGRTADYNRTFKLTQLSADDTLSAVPGVHYVAFDNPEATANYVVKAGQVHTSVPIIILRDESLSQNSYVLKFGLEVGGDFELGDSRLLWRKIYFGDILLKPDNWANIAWFFGEYSRVKHLFMIEATGQNWDESYIEDVAFTYSVLYASQGACKEKLAEYNKAHPGEPMRDENGGLLVFP
ncbi:MAG: DUF4843 domain-containing protein [Bacteroidales bacterium]